ncbi:MAG: transposase [Candidatus Electrothrix sp. GW3-4]|uniref:REP-associated tyrosine transposase n=1 Tax=Candidatus Electrothrix sp. GW3-4 TaxID=3126740 RepID=UPI0030D56F83
MQYRRVYVPGGTYFFTVNLADRSQTLLVDHIDDLRDAVQNVLTSHPFCIDVMVVLPDHLHAIWTLPEGDANYPMRWSLIKAGFSRCIPADEQRSKSRIAKGERGIWQRRYWEHLIRDEQDYMNHVNYIHYNQVKHGHVARVADWPYSTFHQAVKNGQYPPDWSEEPIFQVNANKYE